ncbi:ComEA family DNA-binding protein [Pseudomonas soli]|uniref:ComEA family DNA-binding protein n=1 Tax=Pseudomonas soli TaxID=1306993 RepID=UPI0003C7896C|nr:competence protein ComEA [Pseudomonas soli]
MRNTILPYLFLPLLAGLSMTLNASPVEPRPVETGLVVSTAAPISKDNRLNLNTADAFALQSQLVGIGKAKADAIVAYREAHGDFTTLDELLEVKGIGAALLERNRDKLNIE